MFKLYAIISFAVPFLILGIPIFDICFAIIRRLAKHQNPMKADRGHIHHRLIDMGFSQKQAVAITYMLTAMLGLAAVVLTSSGRDVPHSHWRRICGGRHWIRDDFQPEPAARAGIARREGRRDKREGREQMSSRKIKVMSVFGTRPEAIKMAPLVQELASRPEFESLCCLTGQHRQMLDSVMEIFHLKAQYDLDIMERQQTLSSITTKTLLGMERVLTEAEPDLVLVHGDTSTTFAGALAAFYHKIPVGHVEAGLRTYDPYSPFPEEMNRTLVGDIARLHFAPTRPTQRT